MSERNYTTVSNSLWDRYSLYLLTHSDCLNEWGNNIKVLNATAMHSNCQEGN